LVNHISVHDADTIVRINYGGTTSGIEYAGTYISKICDKV